MVDSFETQVTRAERRVSELSREASALPEQPFILQQAIEELSSSLEELHVAGEEMHAQSEELQAAREQADEDRRRYQELFEFAPDGYLVTNKLGITQEANHTALRLFGMALDDLRGKSLLTLTAPESFQFLRDLLTDLRIGKDITYTEVVLAPLGVPPFPAALTLAATRDADGELITVRWAIRDISERRGLEDQLREANETLEERVQERTAELLALQQRQEDLLRIVSHDLRIPLTMMLGHVQLLESALKERGLNGELQENTDTITRAVRRMNVMIQDLVDMARLESGQLRLDLAPVKLQPFIANLLSRLEGTLDVQRLTLELPPGLPPAFADENRLERIFTNLISNALKYSAPDIPIRITGCLLDSAIEVNIIDQGRGIDPDDLPHLFERFYRTRAGRTGEGLGLGLYITRMLVEAHARPSSDGKSMVGGRMRVESEPSRGSAFTFTLPVAE
ncbi:MAG: PAS domain-containing sensor histidine kinase [Armatimonadota bacterium]